MRGSDPVRLRPKAFELLRFFLANPGRLLEKNAILDAVWPDVHVTDAALKVVVAELREALGDRSDRPRFIETAHRRGYRFVAEVSVDEEHPPPPEPLSRRSSSLLAWPAGGVPAARAAVGLVGRHREIALLEERLARALRGERQIVFVTGEPGAGKTALVEDFVATAAGRATLAITGGQCVEQLGSGEAYLPVLEAVSRLVRDDREVRSLLRRYAPTWFAQIPWLVEEEDRERLGVELALAARERMLREMASFVEALGAEIPLVLVLEDLHWSDPSTVDLLSWIATAREPARLLVIGTHRPVELILGRHPLRAVMQRLVASHRASELPLDALDVEAVAEYVERRFAGNNFPAELPRLFRERTDGNPLFLVTLVDHLLTRGAIVERGERWETVTGLREELVAVPESLRLLIEQQLERLESEDRQLLESASLVGVEFAAAAAAVGAKRDTAQAEQRYEHLADTGMFLRRAGSDEWPDGTVAGRYAFRHSLHRETLAAAVAPRRRSEAHLRIGQALERAYGERSAELAAELALHFEAGGDRARAARHRRSAAETAIGRCAFAEAETHLERGLALLGGLAASPERDREELLLQTTLGGVLRATRGYGAPEAERAYIRALELSEGTPDAPSAFPLLWGLWSFFQVRGQIDRALELAERNRKIADASGDRLMRLAAHHALWLAFFFRGDFAAALRHIDEGESLCDPGEDPRSALVYLHDPKTDVLSYRAFVLWQLGRVDQALETSLQALAHARALGHPLSLAGAMHCAARIRFLRGELEASRELAEALDAHAREHDLPHWEAYCLQLHGSVIAAQGELAEGTAELEKGFALAKAIGTSGGLSVYLTNLVAARMRVDHLAEARADLERCKELLAIGERFHEPEIRRLDAELHLAEAGGADAAPAEARERAERLLHEAIECASRQESRTFELRAATALARLLRRGAKARRAREHLAALLDSFTEGFDTADLQEANRVLAASSIAGGRGGASAPVRRRNPRR